MTNDILTGFNTRATPQTERATEKQIRNAAGGYVFAVTPLERLRRFLILGTDAGTYYTRPLELTKANAVNLMQLAQTDHGAAVDMVVDVSLKGSAPKQNATMFALAVLASHGTTEERAYALAQLNKVARTGTMLFLFARYVEQFRGWGPALKRAVADWYLGRPADKLAFQVVKYQQREGWSNRDLVRLSHPKTAEPGTASVLKWIATSATDENTPAIIEGLIKAREAKGAVEVAKVVREYALTWEMLPSEALNSSVVWDALLDMGMGQTALIRQLPRLTRLGMLPPLGGRTSEIAARLVDMERLRGGRVHPVSVLLAQRTYNRGHGAGSDWDPTRRIVDALDEAFYKAFGTVEPTGKRHLLALDVSGSMTQPIINQASKNKKGDAFYPISAREASAAMALVTMATEPETAVVGFTSGAIRSLKSKSKSEQYPGITPLSISPRQRLDDAVSAVSGLHFGGTDASLAIRYALDKKIAVDTFVVYTDGETWAGPEHTQQVLARYRDTMGIPAKLIAVGMTATECTLADPDDALSMNVAGFDAGLPQFIADFSRGL